jgi:hypothetical protein
VAPPAIEVPVAPVAPVDAPGLEPAGREPVGRRERRTAQLQHADVDRLGDARLLRGRAREVDRRPVRVGTAIDHRHRQRLTVVADRYRRAARQRAIGDADDVLGQLLAAGRAVAVEAGPCQVATIC